MTKQQPRLILVGSHPQADREEVLASLAAICEVVLIDRDYPTWQAKYVETHRIAAITDPTALFAPVADLRGEVAEAAVATFNESSRAAVAEVASRLRMRDLSPAPAHAWLTELAGSAETTGPAGSIPIGLGAVMAATAILFAPDPPIAAGLV